MDPAKPAWIHNVPVYKCAFEKLADTNGFFLSYVSSSYSRNRDVWPTESVSSPSGHDVKVSKYRDRAMQQQYTAGIPQPAG